MFWRNNFGNQNFNQPINQGMNQGVNQGTNQGINRGLINPYGNPAGVGGRRSPFGAGFGGARPQNGQLQQGGIPQNQNMQNRGLLAGGRNSQMPVNSGQQSPFGAFGFSSPTAQQPNAGIFGGQPINMPNQQLPQMPPGQLPMPPQSITQGQPFSLPQPAQTPPIPQPSIPPPTQSPSPHIFPSIQDGPPELNNPAGAQNNLKNVGTFMGYPEYTLPDFDQKKDGISAPAAPPAQMISANDDFHQNLRQFSQNEKNGSEFYGYLSGLAGSESTRRALGSIAERANARSARIGMLHNTITKSDFSPEHRNIRKNIGYREGIRLALAEESRSLKSCAELAEATEDASMRDKLNSIIIEKLCQINELEYLAIGD